MNCYHLEIQIDVLVMVNILNGIKFWIPIRQQCFPPYFFSLVSICLNSLIIMFDKYKIFYLLSSKKTTHTPLNSIGVQKFLSNFFSLRNLFVNLAYNVHMERLTTVV